MKKPTFHQQMQELDAKDASKARINAAVARIDAITAASQAKEAAEHSVADSAAHSVVHSVDDVEPESVKRQRHPIDKVCVEGVGLHRDGIELNADAFDRVSCGENSGRERDKHTSCKR
jgi:hypothetical protein